MSSSLYHSVTDEMEVSYSEASTLFILCSFAIYPCAVKRAILTQYVKMLGQYIVMVVSCNFRDSTEWI
jgi:hypothetical protein